MVSSAWAEDLARHFGSAPSPTLPRRAGSLERSEAPRGTAAIPITELRSRMKAELVRKMGEEPFEKVRLKAKRASSVHGSKTIFLLYYLY